MRAKDEIPEHEEVRLPTRAEWEQAAHRSTGDYPWGEKFIAANANTEESSLGQTSPVHMYSDGATPEGVLDLSGNVWEWSQDTDKNGNPYLKGGAYYSAADRVKSSARYVNLPGSWSVGSGFRCVVVPVSR